MRFYKIQAALKTEKAISRFTDKETRVLESILQENSESFFQQNDRQNYIFISSLENKKAVFGAILKSDTDVRKLFDTFREALPFKAKLLNAEEITFRSVLSLLHRASYNDYIRDDDEVLDYFELGVLNGILRHYFGESILKKESFQKDDLMKTADQLLYRDTLQPELQRIFAGDMPQKITGHPVHYLLCSDSREAEKQVCRTLLSALYAKGRIRTLRYCVLNVDNEFSVSDEILDKFYKSCDGSTVLIRYNGEADAHGEYAKQGDNVITLLCDSAFKYRNKVLTVICLPTACTRAKDVFLSGWGSGSLVELHEDIVFGKRANDFLKRKTEEYQVQPDKDLIPVSEDRNKGYTAAELTRIFDEWYDNKLRNTIYPQYKDTETAKAKIRKATPKGSAYEQLQSLIGLSEAKKVISQALNYFKAQKLFADKGMKRDYPSMHMVFTGNPGTAKTTAARLFAQIMKENHLLSKGELYELGRSDLVGQYVGHTAPMVKQAFKRARGSVLFIDEAYSLVDDRDGLYGDEAITTIVQEMENHRDDLVVIFAGYPDKMELFLKKNPGLRSRIAFHIPFEDYCTEDLCSIAEHIATEKNLQLSEETMEKLSDLFDSARKSPDFGNGRYVRNIIEKARMAQASRLVSMEYDQVTIRDIRTILPEDIDISPEQSKQPKKDAIGFIA